MITIDLLKLHAPWIALSKKALNDFNTMLLEGNVYGDRELMIVRQWAPMIFDFFLGKGDWVGQDQVGIFIDDIWDVLVDVQIRCRLGEEIFDIDVFLCCIFLVMCRIHDDHGPASLWGYKKMLAIVKNKMSADTADCIRSVINNKIEPCPQGFGKP